MSQNSWRLLEHGVEKEFQLQIVLVGGTQVVYLLLFSAKQILV